MNSDFFTQGHARSLSPERLDWNLLRTFMFIVQEQGIGKAANTLHLTQPAVSQALKRLEETLETRLISRGNGKFRLTPTGEVIYMLARDMYGTVALPLPFTCLRSFVMKEQRRLGAWTGQPRRPGLDRNTADSVMLTVSTERS